MLILEAILNFRKARIIRRLYKYGLLDAIRPWLTLGQDEETESLIDCTLNFLLEMWITKSLISNYDFGIGKAIVKVKKNGSPGQKRRFKAFTGMTGREITYFLPGKIYYIRL